MPDLDHHLMCAMELRANGVIVNDCLCMFCDEPDEKPHAIVAQDKYGEAVVLPFFLRGVTPFLNVELLSLDEFEAHGCPRVELTDQHLTWQPHSSVFKDQKNAMVDHHDHIVNPRSKQRRQLMIINSVTASNYADVILEIQPKLYK